MAPAASRRRRPPRRSSTDQMMPLPQAPCASATVGATRTRPEIGLRQPIETIRLGDGCTATLCGFMRPGTFTSWSGRIGDQDRRLVEAPPLDEFIITATSDLPREITVDLHGSRSGDPEVVEPGGQGIGLDAMRPGQRRRSSRGRSRAVHRPRRPGTATWRRGSLADGPPGIGRAGGRRGATAAAGPVISSRGRRQTTTSPSRPSPASPAAR